MKKLIIPFVFFAFIPNFSFTQNHPEVVFNAVSFLQGDWVIDLRPAPDAEPYFKKMTISFDDEKQFSGEFYNTSFDNGEINTIWGIVYFAFSTKDGRTDYSHVGYIENDYLRGITYCDKRDFVMPWIGKRKEEITK